MIPDDSTPDFQLLLKEFNSKGRFRSRQFEEVELLEHRITGELIVLKKQEQTRRRDADYYKDVYSKRLGLQHVHIVQMRCTLKHRELFRFPPEADGRLLQSRVPLVLVPRLHPQRPGGGVPRENQEEHQVQRGTLPYLK